VVFYVLIKEGNTAYKLLNIYTPLDLMMIKSFFISENIPYYIEFEYLMKVQPYIHCLNYNNVNIYILDEDYNDAIIIINNYINSKKLNTYKVGNVFRSIFEYICTSWVIPSPHYFLGIEIYYKKE